MTHLEKLLALSGGKWGTHKEIELRPVNGGYDVHHRGQHIGRVALTQLPKAGKGWMAWDHRGSALDAFEQTRAEAIGHVVRNHLATRKVE